MKHAHAIVTARVPYIIHANIPKSTCMLFYLHATHPILLCNVCECQREWKHATRQRNALSQYSHGHDSKRYTTITWVEEVGWSKYFEFAVCSKPGIYSVPKTTLQEVRCVHCISRGYWCHIFPLGETGHWITATQKCSPPAGCLLWECWIPVGLCLPTQFSIL